MRSGLAKARLNARRAALTAPVVPHNRRCRHCCQEVPVGAQAEYTVRLANGEWLDNLCGPCALALRGCTPEQAEVTRGIRA